MFFFIERVITAGYGLIKLLVNINFILIIHFMLSKLLFFLAHFYFLQLSIGHNVLERTYLLLLNTCLIIIQRQLAFRILCFFSLYRWIQSLVHFAFLFFFIILYLYGFPWFKLCKISLIQDDGFIILF